MEAPMEEDTGAKQRAISFLNEQFGGDVNNLEKAKQLYDNVKATRQEIEQKLSFVNSSVPGQLDSAVHEAESSTHNIEALATEQAQLGGDIRNLLINTKQEVTDLKQLTDKIDQLQKYAAYLQWVGQIEDLSSDIQSALIINSIDLSVRRYVDLLDLVKSLDGSQCTNLTKYANDTLLFWYKILKDKFAGEFSDCLRAWGWPFIVVTTKAVPLKDAAQLKEKLEPLFTHLVKLQLPDGMLESAPVNSDLPEWRPLLLPLQLMLKPLATRFRFHFEGSKQTNSVEKPEWYFTQILSWIRDHRSFLVNRIQPLLDKQECDYVDAVSELSRGLVLLAMRKMEKDIPELMYDDHQFSHLIDEALAFDKDLRLSYGYGASQPSCLYALLEETAFKKWIRIERKFAMEKMDNMMSSDNAWQWQYKDVPELDDDLKIPECGEAFITLMLTMTERYKPLPYPSHKLQFLGLQLELLEDFRARLAQVKSAEETVVEPLGHVFAAILNTASYVEEVLNEWRELPFFLQLQYYKSSHVKEEQALRSPADQSSRSILDESKLKTMERSVFDGMIELLQHMKNEMLGHVVSYVVDDVKARSRPYRNDKWLTLPSQKELGGLALSVSACEMFVVLKDHLHHMQQRLSTGLFEMFWQRVATNMDAFIFKEVILSNHFNEGGAAQLSFDMTRNLFPLFGQFTSKPENYFKSVKEACLLLNQKAGSVRLLKEVLYQALHEPRSDPNEQLTDPVAALHDMGVSTLSLDHAELVLSLRTDLS